MPSSENEDWRREDTEESVITNDANLQESVSELPAQREQSEGKAPSRLRLFVIALVIALAQGDMTKKDAVRKGRLYDALYSMDEALRRQEEAEANNAHNRIYRQYGCNIGNN